MMQDNVGIVRTEAEMQKALGELQKLWQRARAVGVIGHREFNPGWHTVDRLEESADRVRSNHARWRLNGQESRGAQFRDDYPAKDDKFSGS